MPPSPSSHPGPLPTRQGPQPLIQDPSGLFHDNAHVALMLLSQHPQHPSSHGLIQNVQAPDPSCIKVRSTSSDVVRGDQESTASMFHHPTSTSAGDCQQSPASHMDIANGETKENKGAALVMREIQNMEDNRVSTSPKQVGIYVGTNHEAQSLTIPSTVQAHQTPAMDMVDVPSSPPQPHSLNTVTPQE